MHWRNVAHLFYKIPVVSHSLCKLFSVYHYNCYKLRMHFRSARLRQYIKVSWDLYSTNKMEQNKKSIKYSETHKHAHTVSTFMLTSSQLPFHFCSTPFLVVGTFHWIFRYRFLEPHIACVHGISFSLHVLCCDFLQFSCVLTSNCTVILLICISRHTHIVRLIHNNFQRFYFDRAPNAYLNNWDATGGF